MINNVGVKTYKFVPKVANKLTLIRTGGGYGGVAWAPHEHPFRYMGPEKYDQNTGNGVCINKWLDLPLTQQVVLGAALKSSLTANGEVNISGKLYKVIGAEAGLGLSSTTDIDINAQYTFYIKTAADNANIYDQWHIWYHVDANMCVANK